MKLVKDKRYKQGIYSPAHPDKLIGSAKPIYRSSYEMQFMLWADHNENVVKWGSENIIIPYHNPITRKTSRYYVDNTIHIKVENVLHKYLIEIKPFAQTLEPVPRPRQHKRTIIYEQTMYIKNQAKWEAAREWAKTRGYEFVILTEKHIFNNK